MVICVWCYIILMVLTFPCCSCLLVTSLAHVGRAILWCTGPLRSAMGSTCSCLGAEKEQEQDGHGHEETVGPDEEKVEETDGVFTKVRPTSRKTAQYC